MDQPTMRRDHASSTTGKIEEACSCRDERDVATHSRFGPEAEKSRSTRSGAGRLSPVAARRHRAAPAVAGADEAGTPHEACDALAAVAFP
jgi:hypothetical protein